VSNGFALDIRAVVSAVGMRVARELYNLSQQGTEFVRASILQNDPSIKQGDGLRRCVRYADNGDLRNHGAFLQTEFGEDVDMHSVEETRRHLRTNRYHDSLYFPRAFHIHPLRYSLLIAKLAAQKGARLYENSKAVSIQRNGDAWAVRCNGGEVRAREVAVCVAALDRCLHPWSGRAVLPISTYVAATEPVKQDVIKTFSAVADTRRAGDYYRLLPDGRLLWGGRITASQAEPRGLADLLRGDMASTFPSLVASGIDYAWSGKMSYALHRMPLIGRSPEGIWYGTGFGGHGLNTTAMAGILLARGIAQKDDSYRLFERFAPRWAGGPFGRIGVQATYWWMQAKDKWDERQTSQRR
jgi:glycine/D-amino acid oxidase-like deaminating enzyme